ncbi:hypothetical protein [Microvirga roseola]|uniref:hypothetical protein n=1 Tax=Microvirga roseola TaxID=2883126 RepID=UPI001E41080F|nr:hypothetical protein [Microvirga roseola]
MIRKRFEKVLEQVAKAHAKAQAAAVTGPMTQRHERLVRARFIKAERLALAFCLTLGVASLGFAAHAIEARFGKTFRPSLTNILPSLENGVPVNAAIAAAARSTIDLDPETTGSVRIGAGRGEPVYQGDRARDLKAPGRGYVVRDVTRMAALVEGPEGLQQVKPGDILPGAGRVVTIARAGAGWVVVTSETVIESAPPRQPKA